MITQAAGVRYLKVAVLGVVVATVVLDFLFLMFPPTLGFCLTLVGRGPEGRSGGGGARPGPLPGDEESREGGPAREPD